jgi:replicative DNA helicase
MTKPELRVIQGGRDPRPPSELLVCIDLEARLLVSASMEAEVLDVALGILAPEHMASEVHRWVLDALRTLRTAGQQVCLTSLASTLRDAGRMAQCWNTFFASVENYDAITPRTADHIARALKASWVRRQLKAFGELVSVRAESDVASEADQLGDLEAKAHALRGELAPSGRMVALGDAVRETVQGVQRAADTGGVGDNPTGFRDLDRLLCGMQSELMLLGARPGVGKTSISTQIAVNVATRGGAVYVASLETTREQFTQRMLASDAGVDLTKLRTGILTPSDWDRVIASSERLSKLPIIIDDSSTATVGELWTRVGQARTTAGQPIRLIVVDYMQLLRPPRAGMKREEAVSENARMLKAMAQELDAPILAVAQLNRDAEKRTDHRPTLADLRESGELEQCARVVLLLYRADYYAKGRAVRTGIADLIVAKNNNGPTGEIELRFDPPILRFSDTAQEDGE